MRQQPLDNPLGVVQPVDAEGALVQLARRAGLRTPAAFAAALLLSTSPAWLGAARGTPR